MPTLTHDKKDLIELIGKDLSDDRLKETIALIKPNVEEVTKDEITIEFDPDRPDLFGVEGLARGIRCFLGIEKGLMKYTVGGPKLSVRVEGVKVRPYIACGILKGIRLSDEFIKSLMNIQEVLHETVGRGRKKVAIGVHDLDKIKPPIVYRSAKPDEKFVPLEHNEEMGLNEVLIKTEKGNDYGHIIDQAELWPVYEDKEGIFSFPPILNSDRTRVTGETKSLFVEVTGTDKRAVLQTLNIIVTNLAERRCELEGVKIKYKKEEEITPNLDEEVVEIDEDYVNGWIGTELSREKMIELLRRMGLDAMATKEGKLQVLVPKYRADVLHPVDIIEDVAIAYGYNNLTPELPNLATIGRAHEVERLSDKIRHLMIGFGFQEIMSPALTNPIDQYDKMNSKREKRVEILNPVSEDYTCLRTWLLPSLVKVLAENKHVEYPQNIFEIGDVVLPDEKEEARSKNVRKIAGAICHSKASFSEIKSIVESLLKNLKIEHTIGEESSPCFIPGRAARIKRGKKQIGFFGEISPTVLEGWELEMPVAAFEINLEEI